MAQPGLWEIDFVRANVFDEVDLRVMNKRPLPVTIISVIFIAFGVIALGMSFVSSKPTASEKPAFEPLLLYIVRITAIVGGVFMLFGQNWARWLIVLWIIYHLVLSILHSPLELLVHALLFSVILYFLFRPSASAFFRL